MNNRAMSDKLLLINASIANRAVFKITFKGRRDIQAANDAGEAMRFADRTPPDLIALDIGEEQDAGVVHGMIKHFRNAPNTRNVPIVLLAGASQEPVAIRGLALGAVDFISKPLSPLVLAARVQRHLDMKREHDSLAHNSGVDQVSGVASLSHFDAHADREWRRALRHHTKVSVAVVDVDRFRAYNEQHGFVAGDEVLRELAGALASVIKRPSDLLARYHGDQFVALLPDTDGGGAGHVAEKLLEKVRDLRLPYAENEGGYVTVSIGLATLEPTSRDGLPEFLSLAAEALSSAKHDGRNQLRMLP
jgi:diguanylate cyclase (GGDEF)-like protein